MGMSEGEAQNSLVVLSRTIVRKVHLEYVKETFFFWPV